jgi:chromosome segregation ATPase
VPQNQQPDNSDLHNDIRKVIDAISQNRDSLNSRLDEIDRKASQLPAQIESLRKELTAMFVPRSEYDPKHAILQDQVKRLQEYYDKGTADAQPIMQEYSVLKQTVKNNTDDIDELRSRQAGAAGRILPWVGTVIAIIGFLLSLFQHVHIT